MVERRLGQRELLENLAVPFKELDGIPALALLGKAVDRRFFDMRESVFNGSGEGRNGAGGLLIIKD